MFPLLFAKLQKEGEDYEAGISIDYLLRLNKSMRIGLKTIKKNKLLVIDVDNLDFVERQEDFGYVLDRIDAELNGLFK